MNPVLTILAGSNGCGKSTLTLTARDEFQGEPVLDPDAVVNSFRQENSVEQSQIEAGKQVLLRAGELLRLRQSFTVETTLSGHTYLRMALRAREDGFLIAVIFIVTSTVEINIQRVRDRVAKGGHDIPEAVQRRRWPRTVTNMQQLLPLADQIVVLDNSSESGYRLFAAGPRGSVTWYEPIPAWIKPLRDASDPDS